MGAWSSSCDVTNELERFWLTDDIGAVTENEGSIKTINSNNPYCILVPIVHPCDESAMDSAILTHEPAQWVRCSLNGRHCRDCVSP